MGETTGALAEPPGEDVGDFGEPAAVREEVEALRRKDDVEAFLCMELLDELRWSVGESGQVWLPTPAVATDRSVDALGEEWRRGAVELVAATARVEGLGELSSGTPFTRTSAEE